MGSQFHHGYVSRGPPIILDGRVSQVQFETLAVFRGPSQVRERLKRWFAYAPALPGLPTASSLGQPERCAGFIKPATHPDVETAKCPESLRPILVLPPLERRVPPLPRALPLRHRYYQLVRQTPSGFPLLRLLVSFEEALQVATSPCCQRVLPDVISENLSCDAWAPITTAGRLHTPGSSSATAAFPTGKWVGLP